MEHEVFGDVRALLHSEEAPRVKWERLVALLAPYEDRPSWMEVILPYCRAHLPDDLSRPAPRHWLARALFEGRPKPLLGLVTEVGLHDIAASTTGWSHLLAHLYEAPLEVVRLRMTRFGPAHMRLLTQYLDLSGVRHLDLSGNPLTDEGLEVLCHPDTAPRHLHTLRLDHCRLSAASMATLHEALAHSAMWRLCLRHNRLEDEGVRLLCDDGGFAGLTDLRLTANAIGPAGASVLATHPSIPHLQRLDLAHNPIGDRGVEALAADLSAITTLNLAHCALGDDAVRSLAASSSLGALHALDLSHNALTPRAATILARAPWLEHLHSLDVSGHGAPASFDGALVDLAGMMRIGPQRYMHPEAV